MHMSYVLTLILDKNVFEHADFHVISLLELQLQQQYSLQITFLIDL